MSLINLWNRIFFKQKNTVADPSKIPTNDSDSREEICESSDLPEWLASSSNFITLKNNFGNRLKCLPSSVGSEYPHQVGLIFLEGTTDCELVTAFSRRIRAIRVEWLAGAEHLISLIGERSYLGFPGSQKTIQPESAVTALQRGQIVLTMENDPILVIAPATFLFFFRKPDSDWSQWLSPELILRLGAFALAIFLPALYMAIISYQYYAVPVKLFFLLAESRLKVPFPPLIEVLILEALLEMFWKGATKMSNPAGIVIGTLGGLLAAVGIAAVGLVTPIASLFCGTAQLASLVLPVNDFLSTIRWIKYGSIIMTAIFGVLGTVIIASLTVAHLISLELSEWPYIQIGKRLKRY